MPPPRLTGTIPGSETSSHTLCGVGKWGVLGLSHIRRSPLIGFLTRAFPANRRLGTRPSVRGGGGAGDGDPGFRLRFAQGRSIAGIFRPFLSLKNKRSSLVSNSLLGWGVSSRIVAL